MQKILEGRTVHAHVNVDLTVQPGSFGVFLDVIDRNGFNFSVLDFLLIEQITGKLHDVTGADFLSDPTRIIFGNDFDMKKEHLVELLDNRQHTGRFIFTIAYDARPAADGALLSEPWSIEWKEPYTTLPHSEFMEKIINIAQSEEES